MSVLFYLNGTDYTDNVVVGTYNINRFEECDKYTDAAETDHYVHLRYRYKGSFDMAFKTLAAYQSFVSAYTASASSSNTWTVRVTPNNHVIASPGYAEITARVSFAPKRDKAADGTDIIRTITVTLEEV